MRSGSLITKLTGQRNAALKLIENPAVLVSRTDLLGCFDDNRRHGRRRAPGLALVEGKAETHKPAELQVDVGVLRHRLNDSWVMTAPQAFSRYCLTISKPENSNGPSSTLRPCALCRTFSRPMLRASLVGTATQPATVLSGNPQWRMAASSLTTDLSSLVANLIAGSSIVTSTVVSPLEPRRVAKSKLHARTTSSRSRVPLLGLVNPRMSWMAP